MKKLIEKIHISSKETVAGMIFHIGILDETNIAIVRCGMGKVNAGICTQLLISKYKAERIINTGFAGSLSSELKIGDIVVSSEAVQHDFDVSPIGFRKGEIPFTGKVVFPADKETVNSACKVISETLPDVRVLSGRI